MKEGYTSVEEQVTYGLDSIDPERKIEVSLRDLMFVYKTLGELISFFHQPLHYPDLQSVEKFLSVSEEGAFHLLSECYYRKLYDVWPDDIKRKWDESVFEHPQKPYFFESKE